MIRDDDSAAAPEDASALGTDGAVARPIVYVLKMFPRLSETFITNEVLELERRGVPVRIVSLMRPTGAIQSEESLRLARGTSYLPAPGERGAFRSLFRDHLAVARCAPSRYARAVARVALRFSGTAWKRFLQAGGLARLVFEVRASHIHAGFAHVPATVALQASRLTGVPFSFSAHAKDLYLSDRKSLVRKIAAARFVWTCTEANGVYLRSLATATPVHVGYHGVNLRMAASVPGTRSLPPDGRPSILAVGRLVPKKGLPHLLEAAAILRDQGRECELTIVGDGPDRTMLEQMTGRLGLTDRVRFLGSRSPREVREYYAKATVVVLPSKVLENGDRDGVPNVLVEAMAMGVPVVSTRVSAIPELIHDGRTGLLAEPGSSESLAAAIAETLDEPHAAAQRAIAAREDVSRRFDLHRNSERLAAILQRHRRPTRALYICADLGVPVRGHKGASAHVRQIASGMAGAGIEVQVLAANTGEDAPDANEFRIPMTPVPVPRWAGCSLDRLGPRGKVLAKELRRLALNVTLSRRALEALTLRRPDFVYERYSLCAVGGGLACKRKSIPWLLEVNAPLAEEEATWRGLRLARLTRWLERWALRNADHLFVVSHPLRAWAILQGVHPDRVSVLPNGVDCTRFHPGVDGRARLRAAWGFGLDDECILIGFSGSLKPWHGGLDLLDAFRRASERDPRLRLVLIGDGPERKAMEKFARRQSLQDRVLFTGAIGQDRVPAHLAACDILVAPYVQQARPYFSPLKVLEYMAVGRPVIVSRIADLPDLVDGSCGILVRPGDRADLTAAMLSLAGDAEMRTRMGLAAAARAAHEDWGRRVEEIESRVIRLRTPRPLREGDASAGVDRAVAAGEPWADPPRVGYILKMFPRFSETFIVNEIVEIERQGMDVRVFSMKRPTGKAQEEAARVRAAVTILPQHPLSPSARVAGAHIRAFLGNPRRYIGALHFALARRDARALEKFVQAGVVADHARREAIGHLHAHFASGPARVAKLASMISGIPFSFTAHAKDLYWTGHRHEDSNKLKKRIKLARFVVTVSRENQRFLEGLGFRIKEGRIRPIYIGLRLEEFPFRAPSERSRSPRPLVLAVGRLIEKKGFHLLLEALASLRARGVPFRCVIAGEGPEAAALADRIHTLGLVGAVHLAGAIPLGRLRRRYYSRARVLAMPCIVARDGDRDGIPTVLMEAMALGVPVVSTRVSGIPEAIEDGVDGYLTDPGDVVTLAERIELLLTDPATADRIACAGRLRAERQFDLRPNAGSLRKLFLRSLAGWPPAVAQAAADATGPSAALGSPEAVSLSRPAWTDVEGPARDRASTASTRRPPDLRGSIPETGTTAMNATTAAVTERRP